MRRTVRAIVVTCLVALVGALLSPIASATSVTHDVVVSDDPVDYTPHVLDGQVEAIAVVGHTVVVGGDFSRVRGANGETKMSRHDIFAFDARTGRISERFTPRVDGTVLALTPGPSGTVFVGGQFDHVAGKATRGLAQLTVPGGRHVGSFGHTSLGGGHVSSLAAHGHWLYVAGRFSAVGGKTRHGLARINAKNGRVDPRFTIRPADSRKGALVVKQLALSPGGSQLVIDGTFTTVSGQPRYQIALVDTKASPPRLADWSTQAYTDPCSESFHTYMRGIDFAPDGSYFVVVTTGRGNVPRICDTAARWDPRARGSHIEPTWVSYTGRDSLYTVAVTGEAVYVGGHQRWENNAHGHDNPGPGAVPRKGIAALDPVNGVPLSWNPTRTRGHGVKALVATPRGLYVGSDTDRLGHEHHGRVGMFPTKGGTHLPEAHNATLPAELYHAENGRLTKSAFDGSRAKSAHAAPTPVQWRDVRAAFMVAGAVYLARGDGELYASAFDGTSMKEASNIDSWRSWKHVTAMFWKSGRVYYTRGDDNRLHYRYFSPSSRIVGSREFVAGKGEPWGDVTGMTYADGHLFYTDGVGRLHRVGFADGPRAGTDTVIGGPAKGGRTWTRGALFTYNPAE